MKRGKGESKRGRGEGIMIVSSSGQGDFIKVLHSIFVLMNKLKKLKTEDRIYRRGMKVARSGVWQGGESPYYRTPIANVVLSHLVSFLKYPHGTTTPDEIDALINTADEFLAIF